MMEQIMDLIKGQAKKVVEGIPGIPENKVSATVDTTAGSLMDGLKKYATPENLSSFTSLFGGGKSGGSDMAGGLESIVVSALTSKVGLNASVAQKIASSVIPLVTAAFKKKIDDDNEPGFNIESLMGGLSGLGSGSSSGGVMGMLGGLFGKKK